MITPGNDLPSDTDLIVQNAPGPSKLSLHSKETK